MEQSAAAAIRLLYRQLPWSLTANVAVGALLVVALWTPDQARMLYAWAAVQVMLVLARGGLLARYTALAPPDGRLAGWAAGFAVFAGASGLMWGSTAVLFLDLDDLWTVLAVSFAIAGMSAGALATLSSHPPSLAAFLLGGLVPLIAVLMASGDRLHSSLAAMVLLFGLGLALVARVLRSTLQQIMKLTDDKQRLLDSMESQVRARTAELLQAQREAEAARAEAERANLAKSKFLAAASHDLRQPAQSLVLFTATLAIQLKDHPAQRIVTHIDQAAGALRGLLDSLLDISKLDAGTVTPQIGPTELGPILQRLATEYGLRAGEQGLRFRSVHSSAWCATDPILLERILRNLIENALRYTARGQVLLGCRRRGGRIEIQVLDTGIGIPPDQLDAIFDEFVQLGNSERDRAHGLGLGLAIVSRLAAMLGHELAVRSAPERGSCFSVLVRATGAPASVSAGAPA